MARTTAGVVAMVAVEAMMRTGVAARTDAAPGREMTVVLHVTDRVPVAARDLVEAEKHVARVYEAIGVRVIWSQGAAALATVDGALHMDVVMPSRDGVHQKCRAEHIADDVFGSAAGPTKRAYTFFGRIADHARLTGSSVSTVLGLVIAHEVGHLLLPAFSHSPSGIMRAHWQGRISEVPRFTSEQGTTIRALLMAANGN